MKTTTRMETTATTFLTKTMILLWIFLLQCLKIYLWWYFPCWWWKLTKKYLLVTTTETLMEALIRVQRHFNRFSIFSWQRFQSQRYNEQKVINITNDEKYVHNDTVDNSSNKYCFHALLYLITVQYFFNHEYNYNKDTFNRSN